MARPVYVYMDVFFRVISLEKEELGYYCVGKYIIYRASYEYDPVL